MNPTSTPTHPRPTQPPAGTTPSPAGIPHPPPAPAPAARQPPATTAGHLCTLLRGNGLTGLYTYTSTNVAVISLPRLTIWIQPAILTWTHDGQQTTWPASDLPGAAARLTRLSPPPTSHRQAAPP